MARAIELAVTGAAGQIGYALVFRIAAGGLYGAEQSVALRLLESPGRMHLLQALQMELKDCAFPLLADVRIGDDPVRVFEGVDWVILLAGRPQHPHERRVEMLRDNAPIFVAHGRAIDRVAPEARILTVANPCNTNCLIAKSHASNVPAEHWFAMTRLDQMRAASMIAEKAGVPVGRVNRVAIWGNHSERVFPDFHNAWINNRPAHEVIHDTEWIRHEFERNVAQRSAEIIRLRGASPAASAVQAIICSLRALSTPTPYELHFSVGVVSDGSYGVPRDLIFSFPMRTEDGKSWSIVQGLYLDSYAQSRIAENVAEVEQEAAAVTDLLGTIR